jgi:hydrogenase-1 operon protein HyaF
MTSLEHIGVQVEQMHGNVQPILNEVAHALDRLLVESEPTVIDLASLPFAPGELSRLESALGTGELVAELDVLGSSLIRATAFPGVWWLEHNNTAGDVVGRYLEITRTPQILMSQDADIAAGHARLVEQLEGESPKTTNGADAEART